MQSPNTSSNALIQSVVHQTFGRAAKELGLSPITETAFVSQIGAFLGAADSIFENTPAVQKKLYAAVLRGEVIATEIHDNLAIAFYVRAYVGIRGIDLRLICENKTWRIIGVIAMYTRALRGSRWFSRSIFAGSVVVAGLLGYSIHGTLTPVAAPVATTSQSKPTTPSAVQSTSAVQTNASTAQAKTNHQTAPATKAAVKTATKPAPKTISFTLKEGMPLDDLSQFLKSHHLVKNATDFDMLMKSTKADQNVKPGTYQFTTNMNQQQLIAAIKQGPKH